MTTKLEDLINLHVQAPTQGNNLPFDNLAEFAIQHGGHSFNQVLHDFKSAKNQDLDELDESPDTGLEYRCSKWAVPFHQDSTSEVKALMSCVGSGKSSAICIELIRLACLQPPAKDGIRRSRVAIIRATNNQLMRTTIKTWRQWIPDDICKIKFRPNITGYIHQPLSDGTTLDMEIEFMSVDDEKFLGNLQGLELTYFWINEAAELRDFEAVFKVALTRIKRYPASRIAPTRWSGGLLDYNPPRVNSPLYNLFEKPDANQAKKFKLYKFPSPIIIVPDPEEPDDRSKARYLDNPEADFHKFQDYGYDYWRGIIENYANDENYVRRMVEGKYTLTVDGKPVFQNFSERFHVGVTTPDRTQKLLMGADGGMFPAVIIAQIINGQLQVHDECVADEVTVQELLDDSLLPLLNTEYPDYRMSMCLDPGNDSRSFMSKITPSMIIADEDIEMIHLEGSNELQPRLDAVNWFLTRRDALKIHPRCTNLIAALHGDYHWKMAKGQLSLNSRSRPEKDRAADIADAFQYLCLPIRNRQMAADNPEGLGEQPAVTRRSHEQERNIYQSQSKFFWA